MRKVALLMAIMVVLAAVFTGCTVPAEEKTNESTEAEATEEPTAEEAAEAVEEESDVEEVAEQDNTVLGIVEIETGLVLGVPGEDPDVTIYKGIPYAAPPVGEFRWKAPQPAESWDGVRVCDEFGKIAVQYREMVGFFGKEFYPDGKPETSEDCLFLNVWTPAETGDEELPVMVYIHGGAFAQGYGNEMEFDGEGFTDKGVILVTINYRLNVFGFFAHPELSVESENGVSGNYGILDQIAALEWVQKNITAFGGDSDNVTVFGQSAGGASVSYMATSPIAKGLMHKGIMQSGVGQLDSDSGTPISEAEALGVEVCEALGVSLEELIDMPADKLYEKITPWKQSFRPCVDGYAISDMIYPDIPYILGYNSEDLKGSGDRVAAFADQQFKLGRENTYLYEFIHALPGDERGAWHSAELWYVFSTLDRCWRPFTDADYELSDRISSYWANFAKSGDPNGEGLPEWSSYTADNSFMMELDVLE